MRHQYLRHPAQGRVRIDSFSFLSPRHFLVTYFQIMPASFVIPSLKVYDFLDTADDPPDSPKLIRTFELPELNSSAIMISMITRSDPSPAPDDGPAMSSGLPFFTSPASRLLVVGIEIIPEDRLTCGVLLFVHHDTLLDERYPTQVISWSQWGPSNTRLMPMDADLNWVCYVHGTKYVRMGPELSPNNSAPLCVYDFNPSLIRRGGDYSLFYPCSELTLDQHVTNFLKKNQTSNALEERTYFQNCSRHVSIRMNSYLKRLWRPLFRTGESVLNKSIRIQLS